ncbi:MAG: hypothetical protein Q9206_002573 [Seirophora lacunosa]
MDKHVPLVLPNNALRAATARMTVQILTLLAMAPPLCTVTAAAAESLPFDALVSFQIFRMCRTLRNKDERVDRQGKKKHPALSSSSWEGTAVDAL